MDKKYLDEKLDSERIHLKRFDVDLAQKMFDYIDEDRERLGQFLIWPKFIQTIEDEVNFIKSAREGWDKHEKVTYGIFRNSDDEYMGNISAFDLNWTSHSAEIGYWILGKFEGKGYMSEAVALLDKKLREAGFNRLIIKCDPKNDRSASIPKRFNYQFEGTEREVEYWDEIYHDLNVFSKVNSDLKS